MAIIQNKGLGRRKAAIARVYIQPGAGQFIVNGKAMTEYFPLEMFQIKALQPLTTTELSGSIAVFIHKGNFADTFPITKRTNETLRFELSMEYIQP